jgi:hypothetical protein
VPVELAVIRGVGPGDDRLRLEHLHRHLVAGLGLHGAHEVLLERQVVHDDQAVAVRDDLDSARILALVESQEPVHGDEAHGRYAPAQHLDLTAPLRRPHPGRRLAGQEPAGRVADHHRPAADLHRAHAVQHGHADVRGRCGRLRPAQPERDGGEDESDQRRVKKAAMSVRTIEMRIEVPSGK